MEERLLIALRDFEAYNPHYRVDKPIKVKKGSILLVDGGHVKRMLIEHDNAQSLFNTEGVNNDVLMICNMNNVDVFDFRQISDLTVLLHKHDTEFSRFMGNMPYWGATANLLDGITLNNAPGIVDWFPTHDIYGNPCKVALTGVKVDT